MHATLTLNGATAVLETHDGTTEQWLARQPETCRLRRQRVNNAFVVVGPRDTIRVMVNRMTAAGMNVMTRPLAA